MYEFTPFKKTDKLSFESFIQFPREILKREEYLWDERTQTLYNYVKSKNNDIYEWKFKNLIKKNELGMDILGEMSNICMFEDDFELQKFLDLFMDWYNNSPQYMLGGYTPIEFINH